MKKPVKKRLVKGVDFDEWAWKLTHGGSLTLVGQRGYWESRYSGKWVRIKYVEVK